MKHEQDGPKISLDKGVKIYSDTCLLELKEYLYPQYVCYTSTASFLDSHSWVVDFGNGKKKEYTFKPKPLFINTEIPTIVGKEDLEISCEGMSPTDQGMMMLEREFSDSSKRSLDIYPEWKDFYSGKFLDEGGYYRVPGQVCYMV